MIKFSKRQEVFCTSCRQDTEKQWVSAAESTACCTTSAKLLFITRETNNKFVAVILKASVFIQPVQTLNEH